MNKVQKPSNYESYMTVHYLYTCVDLVPVWWYSFKQAEIQIPKAFWWYNIIWNLSEPILRNQLIPRESQNQYMLNLGLHSGILRQTTADRKSVV
jgi:hypothetical protein